MYMIRLVYLMLGHTGRILMLTNVDLVCSMAILCVITYHSSPQIAAEN